MWLLPDQRPAYVFEVETLEIGKRNDAESGRIGEADGPGSRQNRISLFPAARQKRPVARERQLQRQPRMSEHVIGLTAKGTDEHNLLSAAPQRLGDGSRLSSPLRGMLCEDARPLRTSLRRDTPF